MDASWDRDNNAPTPGILHHGNAGQTKNPRGLEASTSRFHLRNVRIRSTFHMDVLRMLKRLVVFAFLVTAASCLPPTERDFQLAQTINEMSEAMNEVRQLSYELQDRVDSLTMVVARRDTVIRQLANLAGVPMPP
jgi:hypothetical protein